jgi:hypothetical protein
VRSSRTGGTAPFLDGEPRVREVEASFTFADVFLLRRTAHRTNPKTAFGAGEPWFPERDAPIPFGEGDVTARTASTKAARAPKPLAEVSRNQSGAASAASAAPASGSRTKGFSGGGCKRAGRDFASGFAFAACPGGGMGATGASGSAGRTVAPE